MIQNSSLLTVLPIPVISGGMNDTNQFDPANEHFSLADLIYDLPERLIAQQPPASRDDARLLVVNRTSGELADRTIGDLSDILRSGDLLVLNDTRVIPAKLLAVRETGGKVRGLFIKQVEPDVWLVMLEGSRRLRIGEILSIQADNDVDVSFTLVESCGAGNWRVRVSADGNVEEILNRIGQTPLPPYIRRKEVQPGTDRLDRARYQTVFAKNSGAIAAPTAGLHFTNELLTKLQQGGIEIAYLTLHVGEGTFKPIQTDTLSQHVMHVERYNLPKETVMAIDQCRERGGRVVAGGTTSVRVLETVADENGKVSTGEGDTDLLIYPPYRFRVVDALLTNFHLPKSTLLALVMAFCSVKNTQMAYRHAIDKEYRFFSYGDAMMIQS